MPPGVTESMIPGNEPEEWASKGDAEDAFWRECRELSFCCRADINASLRDGELTGSCSKCGKNLVILA